MSSDTSTPQSPASTSSADNVPSISAQSLIELLSEKLGLDGAADSITLSREEVQGVVWSVHSFIPIQYKHV
jgi:hypothetical protein